MDKKTKKRCGTYLLYLSLIALCVLVIFNSMRQDYLEDNVKNPLSVLGFAYMFTTAHIRAFGSFFNLLFFIVFTPSLIGAILLINSED
jgi:hypothetical protein